MDPAPLSARRRLTFLLQEAYSGGMLKLLGSGPSRWREAKAWLIGRTLGPLCFVSGHRLPMYFAWKLEIDNVDAYESAAALARACGRPEFLPDLGRMAQAERDHERFFRGILDQPAGRSR